MTGSSQVNLYRGTLAGHDKLTQDDAHKLVPESGLPEEPSGAEIYTVLLRIAIALEDIAVRI